MKPLPFTKQSAKAKSICESHYDLHNKKNPGCGACPIMQECHGSVMRSFRTDTYDGLNSWTEAINQAAERVVVV